MRELITQQIEKMNKQAQQQPERIGYKRIEYSGALSEYHTEQQKYHTKSLTPAQKKLYERTVFGISAVDKHELKTMSTQEINAIKAQHSKCQNDLNIWKQEIINEISNQLFKKYFPTSPFTKTLTEDYPNVVDPGFINTIPFKLLGIRRTDIVKRLIKSGILPNDFHKQVTSKTLKTN